MIYSKFGSPLNLISKHEEHNGQLSIQATAGETPDVHHYHIGDMKADGGTAEIEAAVSKLPWRVVQGKKARRPLFPAIPGTRST